MAEKEEQAKPLAHANLGPHRISNDDHAISIEQKKLHHHNYRKYIKGCSCIAVLILILIILVLNFTVFRVKDPEMNINSGKIKGLDGVGVATLRPDTNLTVVADISVKNPNVANFKFGNTTTTLYYDGVMVGEGINPAGVAEAGRTARMNVTVDVIVNQILGVPRLMGDLNSGKLDMKSYTSIGGVVKILNIFKKHVGVKMNCTMTVNITSQEIQDQVCKQLVSF